MMSDIFKTNNYVPWFMYDITNRQIITSATIPGDISDTKDILLTETPIPGKNFAPIQQGGNGNRKISFTLPLMKRDNILGNSVLLKQFAQLRNQYVAPGEVSPQQFNPNPRVLYYWGTGSVPMIYFVKTISFSHKARWVNAAGYPQYSEVQIELWLDENSLLYKAEESFRRVGGILAQANPAAESISRRIF
jgi:hypothetical protein